MLRGAKVDWIVFMSYTESLWITIPKVASINNFGISTIAFEEVSNSKIVNKQYDENHHGCKISRKNIISVQ